MNTNFKNKPSEKNKEYLKEYNIQEKAKCYERLENRLKIQYETNVMLVKIKKLINKKAKKLIYDFSEKDHTRELSELDLDIFIADRIINKINSGELDNRFLNDWKVDQDWAKYKLEDYTKDKEGGDENDGK